MKSTKSVLFLLTILLVAPVILDGCGKKDDAGDKATQGATMGPERDIGKAHRKARDEVM